jgi:hypothetical protein
MEGIPGIQNINYQAIYGAGQDEEEIEKMKQARDKWIKAQAGQVEPGVAAPQADGAGALDQAGAAGAQGQAGAATGEIAVDKNGTKLHTDTAITIKSIFDKAGKSGLKADELAAKLKEQGIDAYPTEVNGKMALKFANGDTFVDTSGNGILDSDDQEWKDALKAIEGKTGGLQGGGANQGALGADGQNVQAINENGLAKLKAAGVPNLPDPTFNGPRGLGGAQQNPQQLQGILEDLDTQLGQKGYQGPAAQELLDKGDLEQVLGQYGIALPELQGNDGTGGDFVNRLFGQALQIAKMS